MFRLNDKEADIVFVGDSITSRGAYDEFFSDKQILNRGIGSDVAEGVYNRIDEVISHRPNKVFIMIGINDISREIPFDDSIEYYRKAVEMIQEELPDCKIYVESVLPTNTEDGNKINQYNEQLQRMCSEQKIAYINLYDKFLDSRGEPNEVLICDDGIHLNGEGYKVIRDELAQYIY